MSPKDDFFRSLSPEELAKVKIPSPEEVRHAMRKGQMKLIAAGNHQPVSEHQKQILAIEGESARVATALDHLVVDFGDREFYSTEVVNAWRDSGDEAWGDRRRAYSVVQRHLRKREDSGWLIGRFEPRKTGEPGFGRRYYRRELADLSTTPDPSQR